MAANKKTKKKFEAKKAKKVLKKNSSPKKKAAPSKKIVQKSAVKQNKKSSKKTSKAKSLKNNKQVKIKKNISVNKKQTRIVPTVDYTKVITPLLDRLVVKVLSGERLTAGGLIIPDTANVASGYLKAKVLAIGSGIKTKKGNLRPLDVKVGDVVLFTQHAGTEVKFNSEELKIIHESDVMGVVQE
jgi:chaperonin GroES